MIVEKRQALDDSTGRNVNPDDNMVRTILEADENSENVLTCEAEYAMGDRLRCTVLVCCVSSENGDHNSQRKHSGSSNKIHMTEVPTQFMNEGNYSIGRGMLSETSYRSSSGKSVVDGASSQELHLDYTDGGKGDESNNTADDIAGRVQETSSADVLRLHCAGISNVGRLTGGKLDGSTPRPFNTSRARSNSIGPLTATGPRGDDSPGVVKIAKSQSLILITTNDENYSLPELAIDEDGLEHNTIHIKQVNTDANYPLPELEMDEDEEVYKEMHIKQANTEEYMKLVRESDSWRLVPAPYQNSKKESFLFTSHFRHGYDDDGSVKGRYSYNMYVISFRWDKVDYYLHPEDDGTTCDVMRPRLSPASPYLFTSKDIKQEARKYFFCLWRESSKPVLECFGYQGYYISFESKEIIARKTQLVHANNFIDICCT